MDVDADPLQQARFFQRLPAAQDGVADDRVVLSKKPGRERLPDRLLLEKSQRPEAAIGEEASGRASPSWRRSVANSASSLAGRQRVTQPFPGVALIRGCLVALHDGQRLSQSAQRPNSSRPSTKSAPAFRMRSRSHSSWTSVWIGVAVPSRRFLRARPDPQHEVEQVVRLVLLLAQPAAPARLVRLVEDDRAELALEQVLALLGVVEDQAGGDDGDAKRAARDVLRRHAS